MVVILLNLQLREEVVVRMKKKTTMTMKRMRMRYLKQINQLTTHVNVQEDGRQVKLKLLQVVKNQ